MDKLASERRDSLKVSTSEPEWKWDTIKLALTIFKALNRHVNVPPAYAIPNEDAQWPPPTWNMPLGTLVQQLTPSALTDTRRRELSELGVVLGPIQPVDEEWEMRVQALTIYASLHGDMLVPGKFIVPESEPWPESMHGLTLGRVVRNLRRTFANVPETRRCRLATLGFVWKCTDHQWDMKKQALETFKQVHGNLLVPQTFDVPANDPQWPKAVWGYRLGRAVDKLRETAGDLTPDKSEWLTSMGFVWRCRRKRQMKKAPMYPTSSKRRPEKDIHLVMKDD
ncbi:Aste57867_22211 [Aphanomyces stellatus]|uniref:Aste57867_22211 protein n=1 Tax=Aphanomyces stellatus TaxID=120398 RepID=A0A485LLJ1_9STRA|nr:hypothetical protein As57867_022142 [Aphanomyces stellatus]VFT98878.1 Aste57867_22211 [Aphanomyces stellatus]